MRSHITSRCIDAVDKTLIPGATNAELKALLVKVRPAFVAHLEHAKTVLQSLGGQAVRPLGCAARPRPRGGRRRRGWAPPAPMLATSAKPTTHTVTIDAIALRASSADGRRPATPSCGSTRT